MNIAIPPRSDLVQIGSPSDIVVSIWDRVSTMTRLQLTALFAVALGFLTVAASFAELPHRALTTQAVFAGRD